ncbi:hypothetical protein Lal_00028786, partial [Lupinus albus]
MIAQALQTGGGPNISDAYTINALPGSGSLYITLLCTVELQNTNILGSKSHLLHHQGFNFYVVGQGFGNFNNSSADTAKFNLVDPVRGTLLVCPLVDGLQFDFLSTTQ